MINIPKRKYNIFLLGDVQVGKTSFVKKLRDSPFNPDEFPTIGCDVYLDKVVFGNDKSSDIKIFDPSGNEKYKENYTSFLKLADAFVLMFSLNNMDSFQHLENWYGMIEEFRKKKNCPCILVGSKSDLKGTVPQQEILNFSQNKNIEYLEVSNSSEPDQTKPIFTRMLQIIYFAFNGEPSES